MMNHINLIGRLTRDPELRYTQSGKPVANFTLAVDRSWKNGQGKYDADFIDIVAWNKTAELVANHLVKGRLVAVEGRLQIRSYTNPEGQKRKAAEVVTDRVHLMPYKKANGENGATGSEDSSESAPSTSTEPQAATETDEPEPVPTDEDDRPF